MSETPSLKRDSTMAVTAQEGEAFLEAQGMSVTDDDAKTRGQKEKLEEIQNEGGEGEGEGGEGEGEGEDPPKVTRAGTIAVTAEEGVRLLDGCGDLERTRAQTAVVKETVEESKTTSPAKPAVVRDSTMVATAQEGEALLEGQKLEKTRRQTKEAAAATAASPTTPTKVKRSTTIAKTAEDSSHILGSEERGRTRSQTRRMSEKEPPEDEATPSRPAVKRTSTMAQTAKEGEEFLERQAKQAKLDENGDKPAPEEVTEAEV